MSRTDVHRPWPVQLNDPAVRRTTIVMHHHWERSDYDREARRWLVRRSVPCDLESAGGLGRCRVWPVGRGTCGCRVCTGHHERKQARRRDRHHFRAALRAAVKDPRADIDLPARHLDTWQ